jgi:hypothetical protein
MYSHEDATASNIYKSEPSSDLPFSLTLLTVKFDDGKLTALVLKSDEEHQ